MRIALTFSLLIACAVAAGQGKPVDKYASKEGRYSVQFPDKPMKSTKKTGGVDLNVALVAQGMGAFGVVYSDLPPETTKIVKPKELIDGGQQKGFVESFKAKITSSKDFEFGKEMYPAREIVGANDQLHLRIQIILAGDRVYQLLVVGPKDLTTSPDADAFFKSFEITK